MKRAFISYAEQDSEIALQLATQLRGSGADVFIDYDRMMNGGGFTRRLANEIRGRDTLLLLQSPEALRDGLVQAELEFAYEQGVEILPLKLKPLDIRDTGEFRFVLHMRPIDISGWSGRQSRDLTQKIIQRLNEAPNPLVITPWNAPTLEECATLNEHSSWVLGVTFSPDGKLLASCSNDNKICLWDMRHRPTLLSTFGAEHNAAIWSIAFARTQPYLASGGNDGAVRLWDLDAIPEAYEFTRFQEHKKPVYAVAFSPNSELLASASHDSTVIVRDIQHVHVTGRADNSAALLHTSQVYGVAFSPDGRLIASASRDSSVRLWHIDGDNLTSLNRTKPEFLTAHKSWVNAVTFSADGLMIASSSNDHTVMLWDVKHREVIGVLAGHTDAVNTAAFSPDGSVIATASKDNTVRLWHVATGEEIARVHGHSRFVHSLAFSPDGALLVTASGDGTMKFWGVRHEVESMV